LNQEKQQEQGKRLLPDGGSKMSHVYVNWLCDNCGNKCCDLTCKMCGQDLKDYREKLLQAEVTDKAITHIKKVIEQ